MTDGIHEFDLLIKNVRVARPDGDGLEDLDIAIRDGRFASLAPDIAAGSARETYDARNRIAFPGVVDPHMHCGIYGPLEQDAQTESRAAAQGGVTSSLNYMRTGQYYLNKGGPYADFFPEVLAKSDGRFHVDYCYHLAPMDSTHISELPMLVGEHGVTSFKIFMFYGSYGLHGASASQNDFLMISEDERYDYAHFEFVMRGVRRAMQEHPDAASAISLSLHCETAEIMQAYTKMVREEGALTGLHAYHAARPPHSEGLAICIASYLAHETELPNINLLHLSSAKAVDAALRMQGAFPHIDFRREVTIGHLVLDVDTPNGNLAKVNPPIRPREDVEFLWEKLLERELDWVCSDHACCRHERKVSQDDPDDIWLAKSGFGGTEYLLSALVSEGRRRGMSFNHMAEVTSLNPARRFGLSRKGDIAEGLDADLAIVDPDETWTVRAEESESQQGYTPFEGVELDARVKTTFLRGSRIYDDGAVIGAPTGEFIRRPM